MVTTNGARKDSVVAYRVRRFLKAWWFRLRPHSADTELAAILFVRGLPSYLCGLLRSRRDRVRNQWPGADTMAAARRVAVFVHFDRQGEIHDWLVHYLRELRRAEFCIIFVSNAPWLSEEAVAKVQPHCGLVLRRDNIGYDFGAYRDGIRQIPDLGRLDALLLANDSVYGPFHPIADMLARMSPDQASIWGMTDSIEGGFHLQSYFLLFHRAALQDGAFGRFWQEFRFVQSRYWVILKYEIGLTRAMKKAGLRCRALFSCRQADVIAGGRIENTRAVMDRRKAMPAARGPGDRMGSLNPTHELWDVLIGDMGYPFIKRDLLRSNNARVPDLQRWRALIESVSDYDTGMIARDAAAGSECADL